MRITVLRMAGTAVIVSLVTLAGVTVSSTRCTNSVETGREVLHLMKQGFEPTDFARSFVF